MSAKEYITIKFREFKAKMNKKIFYKIVIGLVIAIILIFNISFECKTKFFKFKYDRIDPFSEKEKANV